MEGETITKICSDRDYPSLSTAMLWLNKGSQKEYVDTIYAEFSEQYARAREIQAEVLFDRIQDISDKNDNDTFEDGEGNPRLNHEWVARNKLQVDSLKWRIARMRPDKYADKQRLDASVEVTEKTPSKDQIDAIARTAGRLDD